LRLEDLRLAQAVGLGDGGAAAALGGHLQVHRVLQFVRHAQVADLDADDLGAPRIGRLVDDRKEDLVDLGALGQRVVEVHGADDAAQIGRREVDDRLLEVLHLVGGARGVVDAVEHHAVGDHRGIVLGDDGLLGDVEHLLHDGEPAADAVDERHDDPEAGVERAGVASEALDRPVLPLGDGLDAGVDDEDRHAGDDEGEGEKRRHVHVPQVAVQASPDWRSRLHPCKGCQSSLA
jgi:hypothetical protein